MILLGPFQLTNPLLLQTTEVNEESKIAAKAIERRKQWRKFGRGRDDMPGPDPISTLVNAEIFMQFLTGDDVTEKNLEIARAKFAAFSANALNQVSNGSDASSASKYVPPFKREGGEVRDTKKNN